MGGSQESLNIQHTRSVHYVLATGDTAETVLALGRYIPVG